MDNLSYLTYLSSLLTSPSITPDYQQLLDINIYQTLLNLNHNYQEEYLNKELATIEDYLRKLNNLKVKIQLKRKETEIDTLMHEVLTLYDENKDLIDKYNLSNLDTHKTINNKDPQILTMLIDTETKEKIRRLHHKDYYDELRNKLINLLPTSKYEIHNSNILLTNKEETFEVSLKDFYQVFEYLLNIDNYQQPLSNIKANRSHTIMAASIIKFLLSKEELKEQIIIPLILSYLMTLEVPNVNLIDTSKFKIDNIKISDLYSLAKENDNANSEKRTSWRKITIPNTYLYQKIKEIILKGTYYFDEDSFILENIDNSLSDFKISISISDMKDFLKANLALYQDKEALTK